MKLKGVLIHSVNEVTKRMLFNVDSYKVMHTGFKIHGSHRMNSTEVQHNLQVTFEFFETSASVWLDIAKK